MDKKHLHIIFSLILFLSFSWQSVAKSAIFIKYQWNKKEIAKTLCENKDKPKSCCAGKCYLGKELKKEDERQGDKLPASIKDKAEKSESTTCINYQMFIEHYFIQNLSFVYLGKESKSVSKDIFHPPSFTV